MTTIGTFTAQNGSFTGTVRTLTQSVKVRISPADKDRGITSHSKLIINACRPYAWFDAFPPTTALSRAEARAIEAKWLPVISGRA